MNSRVLIEKAERVLKECDKHVYRIEKAKAKMQAFMPLDSKKYARLSDDEIGIIDQFLFRFGKLQDAMGQKLFRITLELLEENIEGKPFIDILNLMEKLNLIASADLWKELREYRNEIAHNYEDNPAIGSQMINALYEKSDFLISTYSHIKNFLKEKFNLCEEETIDK